MADIFDAVDKPKADIFDAVTPQAQPDIFDAASKLSDEDLARQTTAKWVTEKSKEREKAGTSSSLLTRAGDVVSGAIVNPIKRAGEFVGEAASAASRAPEPAESNMPWYQRMEETAGNSLLNALTPMGAYRTLSGDPKQISDPVARARFLAFREQLSNDLSARVARGELKPEDIQRIYQGASDIPALLMPASGTAGKATGPLAEMAEGAVTRAAGEILPKVGGLINAAGAEVEGAAVKRIVNSAGQFAGFGFKYMAPDEDTGLVGRIKAGAEQGLVGAFFTPAAHLIGKPIFEYAQKAVAAGWKPAAEWFAGQGVEKQATRQVTRDAVNEIQSKVEKTGVPLVEALHQETQNLKARTDALVAGLQDAVGRGVPPSATTEGAAAHNDAFQQAKALMPEGASVSEIAQKAQQIAESKNVPQGTIELSKAGELASKQAENVATTGTYGEEAKPIRREMARNEPEPVKISVDTMRQAKIGLVYLTGRLKAVEGMAMTAGDSTLAEHVNGVREGLNGLAKTFHSMTREWGLVGQELQKGVTPEEVSTLGEKASAPWTKTAPEEKLNQIIDAALGEKAETLHEPTAEPSGKAESVNAAKAGEEKLAFPSPRVPKSMAGVNIRDLISQAQEYLENVKEAGPQEPNHIKKLALTIARALDVEGAAEVPMTGKGEPSELEKAIGKMKVSSGDVSKWLQSNRLKGQDILGQIELAIRRRMEAKVSEPKESIPSLASLIAKAQDVEGAAALPKPKGSKSEIDQAVDSMTVKKADVTAWMKSLQRISLDMAPPKANQTSALQQVIAGTGRLNAAIRIARMGMLSLTSPIGAALHSGAWAMANLGESGMLDVLDRVEGNESSRMTVRAGALLRAVGRSGVGMASDALDYIGASKTAVGQFFAQRKANMPLPAVFGETQVSPIISKRLDPLLYPHVGILGRVSQMFGDYAFQSSLYDGALKAAQAQGLKGPALTDAVRTLVGSPTKEIEAGAQAAMKAAMFRRDLPQVVESLTRSPLATLFVNPFTHFSAQALRLFSEYTVASPEFWSKLVNGKASGEDLARYLTRNFEGLAGVYTADKLLYNRVDFNRMEYVREDGKRISLRGSTPIVDMLGVAALVRGDYKAAAQAAEAGVLMFPSSGGVLGPLFEAIKDSAGGGTKGTTNPGRLLEQVNRLLASTYPGNKVLAAINSLITKDVTSYRGPMGWAANTPGLSQLGQPAIDPTTGKPQQRDKELIGTNIPSPDIGARGVQRSLSPIQRMLAELGFSHLTAQGPKLLDTETGKPYKTPSDVPDSARREYEQHRGEMINKFLEPLATNPDFRNLPFAIQQQKVKAAIARASSFARKLTNISLAKQHQKRLTVTTEPQTSEGFNPMGAIQ